MPRNVIVFPLYERGYFFHRTQRVHDLQLGPIVKYKYSAEHVMFPRADFAMFVNTRS